MQRLSIKSTTAIRSSVMCHSSLSTFSTWPLLGNVAKLRIRSKVNSTLFSSCRVEHASRKHRTPGTAYVTPLTIARITCILHFCSHFPLPFRKESLVKIVRRTRQTKQKNGNAQTLKEETLYLKSCFFRMKFNFLVDQTRLNWEIENLLCSQRQ